MLASCLPPLKEALILLIQSMTFSCGFMLGMEVMSLTCQLYTLVN